MEEVAYNIYEKAGSYFTGTCRRIVFYTISIILFSLVLFFSFFYKIVISVDSLYWIFSSIVQSLVALVSLFGVLAIFKYQTIFLYEERILNKLQEHSSPLAMLGGGLNAINVSELIKNIEAVIGKDARPGINDGVNGNKLRKVQSDLKSNEWSRKYLYEFVIKFAVYTFIVVILNLLFLVLTPYIVRFYLGLPVVFLSIFLTSYALFLAIKIIAETLNNNGNV